MSVKSALNSVRRRFDQSVAVVVCAALVLVAGARLVTLSLQQHALQARSSAQLIDAGVAQSLQTQLQSLVQLAERRSALTASTAPGGDVSARLKTIAAARNAFWVTVDGSVVGPPAEDRTAASDIAAEWSALAPGAAPRLLGPVRHGSQWLVVASAPFRLPAVGGNAQNGWSVVYRPLDSLLLDAGLDRAVRAGYAFEFSHVDPESHGVVDLIGSTDTPLSNPVISAITADAASGADSWQLASAPRAGWFPTDYVVVDVSLVILVTWLVALGVRDVTHHMSQLRSVLAASRRRLLSAQHRLSEEIELRQRLQLSFEHAHHHDSVTGLPNRHYFVDQLDRILRAMRTGSAQHGALVLISVDRYKVIVDTVGHTAGDELMVQITGVFHQALSGREHVLARWADDELALLLTDVPSTQSIFDTVSSLQETLHNPIVLRRHRVAAATSAGATRVDTGLQRAEEALREADLALSRAKAEGGSKLVLYNSAMQAHLLQAVSLEADLYMALERQEFRLVFQPIVDLRARHVVGVEVLLRWLHPVEGLLAPNRFLSFIEEAGLIVPITRWIILRACQLSGEWRLRMPPESDFYLSINLSPAALLDPGLTDYVRQVLKDTSTAPASLKFELTENGLINNVGAARHVLDRLHGLGIELMLDDFGSGYSSLSHLQLFPFDYIKIDGPMDSRLGPDQSDGALVRAMTQMASTLGLRTIAETVETSSAVKALEQIGCEFAQGYIFCAPIDADEVVRYLRQPTLELTDEADRRHDSPTMILPVLPEIETS